MELLEFTGSTKGFSVEVEVELESKL